MVNSADPDEMLHTATSGLGHHFPKSTLWDNRHKCVDLIVKFNAVNDIAVD